MVIFPVRLCSGEHFSFGSRLVVSFLCYDAKSHRGPLCRVTEDCVVRGLNSSPCFPTDVNWKLKWFILPLECWVEGEV
ncbi:hypothetical protein MATL_G00010200 [Megalops atlanticus]|uniref:Uncharacterized protein n=1 Tax=Megalops atlanticus TaxID=7932 RepID=A0A9D3TLA0_MEGAT|nr:hypothetical protein MATL_G00010200 [Megalops atlanticus]